MEPTVGTIYITDNKDLIFRAVTDPMKPGPCMVLDLCEQDNSLEEMFPRFVAKATVLLPPASAVFKEIDGDHKGFIDEYIEWLSCDVVVDFLASVLTMLYSGFNTLIYTEAFSEEIVWVNVLLDFIERTYGCHIGTSENDNFKQDPKFHIYNANIMYLFGCITDLQYLAVLPPYYTTHTPQIWARLCYDLAKYGGKDEPSISIYNRIRATMDVNPIATPAIIFDM